MTPPPLGSILKGKVCASRRPSAQLNQLNTRVTSEGSIILDERNSQEAIRNARFPELGQDSVDGRVYKKVSIDMLPIDDEEVERLEIVHLLHKFLFGNLYLSPLEQQLHQGIRVLEVACGPAWWSKEMAGLYPNSEFIGIDDTMFPIQNPPLNFHTKKIDYTKDWPFQNDSFDFVVQREARFQHTSSTWDKVIEESIRVVKPGGHIEFLEGSNEMNDIGPNLSMWVMRLTVSMQSRELLGKLGVDLEAMFKKHDDKVNLVDSSHRSSPVGWLGRAGDLMTEVFERLIDSVKPRICDDWNITPAKYDTWTRLLIPEAREFKSWVNFYNVCLTKK